MRYAVPALAAFFLLAFGAGFLALRPLTAAKARGPVYSESKGTVANDDGWRRTADGWEHISALKSDQRSAIADGVQQIHPLLVAALLALVGIGALVFADAAKPDPLEARLKKFIAPYQR